jgi:hypothetical protein
MPTLVDPPGLSQHQGKKRVNMCCARPAAMFKTIEYIPAQQGLYSWGQSRGFYSTRTDRTDSKSLRGAEMHGNDDEAIEARVAPDVCRIN